jgi:hypothetical protein
MALAWAACCLLLGVLMKLKIPATMHSFAFCDMKVGM